MLVQAGGGPLARCDVEMALAVQLIGGSGAWAHRGGIGF